MNMFFSAEDKCRLSMPSEFASKTDGDKIIIEGAAVNFDTVFPRGREPRFSVLSSAIDQNVVDHYLKKPVLLWSHDMDAVPVGQVLKMEIRPKMLWYRALVEKTNDTELLIRNIERGTVKSNSIGFFMEAPEWNEETGVYTIARITELFDLSLVNLGRDEDAVFEIAQNQNFQMPSLAVGRFNRRSNMSEPKVITEEQLSEVKKDLAQLKTTVKDIDPKIVGQVAKLEADFLAYKSQGDHTKADLEQFFEKFWKDYSKQQETLAAAIKDAKTNAPSSGNIDNLPISPNVALSAPDDVLKSLFTDNRFQQIQEFRKMSDLALFTYQIFNPSRQISGPEKFDNGIRIDPKVAAQFKFFKEVDRMAQRFAMDTATSNEGSQFIPVGYSPELVAKIRLESKVDQLFQTFPMQEANMYVNVEGDDILPTRMTQVTTVQTARADSTEQTPGTAQAQFTAEKLRTRVQLSGEMTEDSMIEIFNYVMNKTSVGFGRGLDKWWLSGDNAGGTGFDSGDAPGATDIRYCGDGLRADAINNSTYTVKLDMSNFSWENICKLLGMLDVYGVDVQKLAWITSAKSYFFNWLGKIGKDYLSTVDKAGPNALIYSGGITSFLGIPIVLSEWMLSTWDQTGVYSGAGNSRSGELVVNRSCYRRGIWRPIAVEIVRTPLLDIYDVVAWHRTDIQKVQTATGAQIVAYGINVPTA